MMPEWIMGRITCMLERALYALLIISVILPVFAQQSYALGISPGRIDFWNEGGTFSFRPIFSNDEEGTVTVRVDGDMKNSIILEDSTLSLGETLNGMVIVPEGLPPGEHTQQLIFTFVPDKISGTVSANVELVALINIKIPYPESYIIGDFDMSTDEGSGRSMVAVTLENLGNKSVLPDSIIISLIDGVERDDKYIMPIVVEAKSFAKIAEEYLGVTQGEISPGIYAGRLNVVYGEKSFLKSKEVVIGIPRLTIDSIKYLPEDGLIMPLDVAGKIDWNRPLIARIDVYVDGSNVPTLSQDIVVNQTFSERIYLDGSKHPLPKNSLKIVVSAASSSVSKEISIFKEASSFNGVVILYVLALVLLLMLLFAAIIILRRKNKT